MSKSCEDIWKDFLLGCKGIVGFQRDSSNVERIFYDTVNFNCGSNSMDSNGNNYCVLKINSHSVKSRTKEKTEHGQRYIDSDIKIFSNWFCSYDRFHFVEKDKL